MVYITFLTCTLTAEAGPLLLLILGLLWMGHQIRDYLL